MAAIPSLFAFPSVVTTTANQPLEPRLPIAIRTGQTLWSYALRFERAKEAAPSTGILVRLTVRVDSGRVGIGCINAAETAFIDEVFVGHEDGATTAEIVIARPADAGPLVVRNASPVDASDVSIMSLDCFEIDLEAEVERQPGLSDPRPCPQWSRYYGGGRTVRERLRDQWFAALAAPETLRWIDGLAVRILPGEQLSRAIYVSGTYEPNTLCVLRRLLQPGDTFVDVGANTGVISLIGSRWVGANGRVYSFEPSLREFEHLTRNLETNTAMNITPVRLAVSSGSGRAALRVAQPSHAGLNTLGGAFPYAGIDTDHIETVETTTLDAFVDAQRIARVAVLKVDVEGAEAAVLQGAHRVLADHRPAMVVEVYSRALELNGADRETVERLLRTQQYRLYSIDDDTAALHEIDALTSVDEQNVVAVPFEWPDSVDHRS